MLLLPLPDNNILLVDFTTHSKGRLNVPKKIFTPTISMLYRSCLSADVVKDMPSIEGLSIWLVYTMNTMMKFFKLSSRSSAFVDKLHCASMLVSHSYSATAYLVTSCSTLAIVCSLAKF